MQIALGSTMEINSIFLSLISEHLRDTGVRVLGKRISLPVIACAVMFGLGHLCLLGMMPPLVVANIVLATTACGFVAGYFRETTGSLIPAIVSSTSV